VCRPIAEATVEDLHNQHPNLMHKISNDILSLQAQLTGQTFDTQKLEQSIIQAFKGDLTQDKKSLYEAN
jgi:Skp family chaperone for outer membrane proteins